MHDLFYIPTLRSLLYALPPLGQARPVAMITPFLGRRPRLRAPDLGVSGS